MSEVRGTIAEVLELAPVQEFEIHGEEYTNKKLHKISKPTPSSLQLNTLQGVIDLVAQDKLKEAMVVISDPSSIKVYSELDSVSQQRHHYCSAKPIRITSFPLDQWIGQEDFVIGLQSQFAESETLKKLIQMIATVTDGTIETYADDGVTQKVTQKNGIDLVKEVALPNPVKLKPLRTFPEIADIESTFVLRARRGQTGPVFRLIPADGEAWKLEAIEKIKAWFEAAKLPSGVKIIA